MKVSKASDTPSKEVGNLRNFNLSVEEIRILRSIKELTRSLEDGERKNTQPERLEYFRCALRLLEDELEEVRENTLIRSPGSQS